MRRTLRRVFVVESYEATRDSLALVLETASGWSMQVFASGDSCLHILSTGDMPDCIVCDLILPDVTAAQLMESLAAKKIAVPVVVTSSWPLNSPVAMQAKQAGAHTVLLKPFSIDELIGAVEQAISASSERT